MIGFPTLPILGHQVHGYAGLVWTKGFGLHESRVLPSGLVLLIEGGFYSEGSRDRVHLTWFRRGRSRLKKVLAFDGMARLDDLPPRVHGDRLGLTTVDEPNAFLVSAADGTFGRDWTWRVEHGVPSLVSCELLAQRLRVVDAAIWRSWNAKHPSSLQRQLGKAWPEPDDLFSWSEKRYGRIWTVKVNRHYVFTLRRAGAGQWNVVGFRKS